MRMDFFSGLIESAIADASAEVTGDGSKFEARVISDTFADMPTIKRHRLVYAALDEHIKSGAIHALTIKAFTNDEWSAQS